MPQKRTPSTFSSLLVSDRRDPVSKTLNPLPSASPAAIAEIQSEKGALLVSRLTGEALTALKDDGLAVNGMIAYDTDKKNFVLYQGDDWMPVTKAGLKEPYLIGRDSSEEGDMVVFDGEADRVRTVRSPSFSVDDDPDPIPAHFVKGPQTSEPGNLAIFNDKNGSEIADSGLNVYQKKVLRGIEEVPYILLNNLGALQFVQGLGVVLVDGLPAMTCMMRGKDAQVCTVFGGEIQGDSSSPSAVLEVNSETGAFLVSRMTTAQRGQLVDPQNGMMVYDTTLKEFMFYQKGAWVALPSGSENQGDVRGPSKALKGDVALFEETTGKKIGASGVLIDDKQHMTGLKSLRISTPPPYDKNYSLWADSGVVALDYYVVSSGKFKTVLARDEEIHEDVESLWNALSFVQYTHHQDEQKRKRLGLIAEEVAKVAPHWVQEHEEGIVLNKSAVMDSACVIIQKLMKEKKALAKTVREQDKKLSYQSRKLDHFIKTFNQRAKKQGAPLIEFEEVFDE